jgi:hypothetical protein
MQYLLDIQAPFSNTIPYLSGIHNKLVCKGQQAVRVMGWVNSQMCRITKHWAVM